LSSSRDAENHRCVLPADHHHHNHFTRQYNPEDSSEHENDILWGFHFISFHFIYFLTSCRLRWVPAFWKNILFQSWCIQCVSETLKSAYKSTLHENPEKQHHQNPAMLALRPQKWIPSSRGMDGWRVITGDIKNTTITTTLQINIANFVQYIHTQVH
jgi:hypothetical protein